MDVSKSTIHKAVPELLLPQIETTAHNIYVYLDNIQYYTPKIKETPVLNEKSMAWRLLFPISISYNPP